MAPTPDLSAQNLGDLTGMVAVVTGAGTGIGLMIAKGLEANGAKVYIGARRLPKLEQAAKQAVHGNLIPLQIDVTDHDDLQRAVDTITQNDGHIDLLVNNAGMAGHDWSENPRPLPTPQSSVAEIRDYYFNYRPQSLWDDMLVLNTRAVFMSAMAFLELLDNGNKKRDPKLPRSQIITVGSVGGVARFTDEFIYNASKAGAHILMQNLGAYLAPNHIRTNTILPGWFPSEMTVGSIAKYEKDGGRMPNDLVPQERMGTEEEMAGTILYLASKAGGYCNGNMIVVDGGILHMKAGTF